jgi:hypothetical protein
MIAANSLFSRQVSFLEHCTNLSVCLCVCVHVVIMNLFIFSSVTLLVWRERQEEEALAAKLQNREKPTLPSERVPRIYVLEIMVDSGMGS